MSIEFPFCRMKMGLEMEVVVLAQRHERPECR